MPNIPLVRVLYAVGGESVTLQVKHPLVMLSYPSRQTSLYARLPGNAPQGSQWGDTEAIAEAQAKVDADPLFTGAGYTVVAPEREGG